MDAALFMLDRIKPHLHIIQSTRLLHLTSFVESPSVRKFFKVTKSDQLDPDADLIYCQTYTDAGIQNLLLRTKSPVIVHIGGDVWYELEELHHNPLLLERVQTLLENAGLVVCISKFLYDIASSHLSHRRITYLSGGCWGMDHTIIGIMPDRFPRRRLANKEIRRIVMQISLTIPRKYAGIPVFFEAIESQVEKLNFTCVGDTGGQEILVKKWSERYNINFVPLTEKWPEILAMSDVFIHPSLFDTWGRSVAEAICAGVPTLTFPCGGIPEISNEICFCDPESATSISSQFGSLINNPEGMHQWGVVLRQEAAFKTERHRNDYAHLLFEFMNGSVN